MYFQQHKFRTYKIKVFKCTLNIYFFKSPSLQLVLVLLKQLQKFLAKHIKHTL